MIGIVDYGMGNLLSVRNALEAVGADVRLCCAFEELDEVERIVLPGVGAFGECVHNLERLGFTEALQMQVLEKGKPILGICLGMQAMAAKGYEMGEHQGLGWFDADVIRIQPNDSALKVPHVGWNAIQYEEGYPLFKGLRPNPDFYFVHSYHMKCREASNVVAVCDYGGQLTAAVARDNIFATQFHPEKSQDFGLQVLANFVEWVP